MAAGESLEEIARAGREEARGAARAVEARMKELGKLVRPLKKLSEEWREPKVIGSVLAALPEVPVSAPTEAEVESRLRSLRESLSAWVKEEREGRRRRLAEGLKEGCAAASIPLLVVTKDPLELRLPPVGVSVEVDADRAVVHFGQVEVERASANPTAILAAREKAVAKLDGKGFVAEEFHRDLREAYGRALRAARKGPEEWIDVIEVLPEIAYLKQGGRWRMDPTAVYFHGYGKAQFLFDLWRLRRLRSLVVEGWRLTLGPATGGSTRDKRRVFWVEDEEGRGAYHLTMRFVRAAEVHGDAREDGEAGAGGTGGGTAGVSDGGEGG